MTQRLDGNGLERAAFDGADHKRVAGLFVPPTTVEVENMIAELDPREIMTCRTQNSARAVDIPADPRIEHRIGVGLDNTPVARATARGEWVTTVPVYCVDEVSDQAISLLLGWARGTVSSDRAVKRGQWDPAGAHLRRAQRLACFTRVAFLDNVSPAPLTDDHALIAALGDSRLSGAGLDVDEDESVPPRALADRADVIVRPHLAFSTKALHAELRQRAAEDVARNLAGDGPLYPCKVSTQPSERA